MLCSQAALGRPDVFLVPPESILAVGDPVKATSTARTQVSRGRPL